MFFGIYTHIEKHDVSYIPRNRILVYKEQLIIILLTLSQVSPKDSSSIFNISKHARDMTAIRASLKGKLNK